MIKIAVIKWGYDEWYKAVTDHMPMQYAIKTMAIVVQLEKDPPNIWHLLTDDPPEKSMSASVPDEFIQILGEFTPIKEKGESS